MAQRVNSLANPIVIRPAAPGDAAGLRAACWPDRPHDVIVELLRRAEKIADQQRGLAATALWEDQPAAFAMLTLWPRCAEISDLIVAERLRGRHIGTALIEYLEAAGRRFGASTLEIGAALSNPRALALYQRLGFSEGRVLTLDLAGGPEPVLYLYRPIAP